MGDGAWDTNSPITTGRSRTRRGSCVRFGMMSAAVPSLSGSPGWVPGAKARSDRAAGTDQGEYPGTEGRDVDTLGSLADRAASRPSADDGPGLRRIPSMPGMQRTDGARLSGGLLQGLRGAPVVGQGPGDYATA